MRQSLTNFRDSKEQMLAAIDIFEASLNGMSHRRISVDFGVSVSKVTLRLETIRRMVLKRMPLDVELPVRWKEALEEHVAEIRGALALVRADVGNGVETAPVERKSDREEYPYLLYHPDSEVPITVFKSWAEAITAQKIANATRSGHKAQRR
ncbi:MULTISPECIES: hypothetical protein [unclassified Undibacterium]|nr:MULTISPECIES: hypothetical protein [unclassified Undibacterium]MEB0259625.1 hypothetical protein [Undibacterium sp. 5I1]